MLAWSLFVGLLIALPVLARAFSDVGALAVFNRFFRVGSLVLGGGHVVLVTDTRAAHALNDGQYEDRRRASEAAAGVLGVETLRDVDAHHLDDALARLDDEVLVRRARHVVTEIARVRATVEALEAGDLAGVGHLFDASHASLRDDYEVSAPELDACVDAARNVHGVFGARMTGGGFGGCTVNLVASAAVDELTRVLEHALQRPPDVFVTGAAEGAREVV